MSIPIKTQAEQRCEQRNTSKQLHFPDFLSKHLLHRSDWTEPASFCRFKSAVLLNPTFWLTPLYNATMFVPCSSRKANRLCRIDLPHQQCLIAPTFKVKKYHHVTRSVFLSDKTWQNQLRRSRMCPVFPIQFTSHEWLEEWREPESFQG